MTLVDYQMGPRSGATYDAITPIELPNVPAKRGFVECADPIELPNLKGEAINRLHMQSEKINNYYPTLHLFKYT